MTVTRSLPHLSKHGAVADWDIPGTQAGSTRLVTPALTARSTGGAVIDAVPVWQRGGLSRLWFGSSKSCAAAAGAVIGDWRYSHKCMLAPLGSKPCPPPRRQATMIGRRQV